MERNSTRIILGLLVNAEMWIFLLLNIICLTCILRGRLHRTNESSVYLITAFNLMSESCQLLLHVIYVGPAIFLGSWIFGGQESVGVTVAATWFLGFWYLGSFIQVLMAANRLCVVCFPGRQILTKKRVLFIFATIFSVALGCVIYTQLLSPCCRITPDPRYFGYSYLVFENQTSNPSMIFFDLPIDSMTSLICIVSYMMLFYYVFRMGRKGGDASLKRRELRLCIQFLIIFLCYTITWSTFFVFPMFGIQVPEAYITTTVVFMTNCGVNSVIYLTMNKEVQFEFRKLIGKERETARYETSRTYAVKNQDISSTNQSS